MNAEEVKVDDNVEPVKIQEKDLARLKEIQGLVDTLSKYRQEMGRMTQMIGNLREDANRIELELAEKRRSLSSDYNLEKVGGTGQWALDFENKEFVKTAPGAPVIP